MDEGRPNRAVTPAFPLAAAAAELREAVQAGIFPDVMRRRELRLADARIQLGDKRFEAVWSAGQAMSPDEASRTPGLRGRLLSSVRTFARGSSTVSPETKSLTVLA